MRIQDELGRCAIEYCIKFHQITNECCKYNIELGGAVVLEDTSVT